MPPKISIIVTNYNHASFLKERLDTIFNQTFKDFEVILLDDASTDDSVQILSEYAKDKRVSHFSINTKNTGSPFKQWKKGFELAKGEFVWIAETDDFAEPTFLEETIKILQHNRKVSLVYTDSRIVNVKGESMGLSSVRKNKFFKTQRWSSNHENNGFDEVVNYILLRVTINNASAVLFRKNKLLLLNLDELASFKNVGDMYTYCSVLFKGDISYIALPLNNYRLHSLNVTKANEHSGIFYIDALNCYSVILKSLLKSPLNKLEKVRLQKAYKFIINRFGFNLLDYGFGKDLNRFMMNLSQNKILSQIEANGLVLGFAIYKNKNVRIKNLIKKLIKKWLV